MTTELIQETTHVLADSSVPDGQGRKYGGEPSFRRVKQLLEELWGPSPAAQVEGLSSVRKTGGKKQRDEERNWRALVAERDTWRAKAEAAEQKPTSEAEIRAAYQRGRADLQAEIVFAERLAAIRAKYPDFDSAWNRVRPLVPRAVVAEAADLEHGLEGAYQLSKLPELCQELSEMDAERAGERFRFFVRDLTALKAAAL